MKLRFESGFFEQPFEEGTFRYLSNSMEEILPESSGGEEDEK